MWWFNCFFNPFFRSSYFFRFWREQILATSASITRHKQKTPQSVSGKVNLFQTSSQCSYFSDSWTSKGKVIQQHLCDMISVLFTNSGLFQISPSPLVNGISASSFFSRQPSVSSCSWLLEHNIWGFKVRQALSV